MWDDVMHRTGQQQISMIVPPEGVLDARTGEPGCCLSEVGRPEHVYDRRHVAWFCLIRPDIESRTRFSQGSQRNELSADARAKREDLGSV